ncbi:AraC family transcriptional regulator [Pseudoalteromonas shioyasakiensis]|uniref:AraC family transcriptional regulator n=1 Tax=Pseudoalteromonas shioyasakiensis TaxID=1190813 RepID=UPI002118F74B|nr:AraC family transcriptional regulator [Pseudoalteromonas shioyasakiensis]MCQ8878476.1 AraC family transcriptional regulator [Pseudoalteromonas shioyasakiensis]
MSKQLIERLINAKTNQSGMIESGIKGIQLFRITDSIRCAPAVYEPSVTAILNGNKEAICDGKKHLYDHQRYICCTMSMPIEAGTPTSSKDNPLLGVYITLDTKLMTELVLELQSTLGTMHMPKQQPSQGLSSAQWDNKFTDALYRLLLLVDSPTDLAILSKSRLRELYYAILQGQSGASFKRAFGVGNEVARSIEYLSAHLSEAITIEDMAEYSGMSRAVFHRKFKQATNMSPIQFVKAMRLNNAAMKIAQGTHVNVAAMDVGYVSSSQFSREFKRMYGTSPKQWGKSTQ